MENCEKCSPGIRCVGCSDGNHVSHHEKSVRLRESEISTVCGEFIKVEVAECHPFCRCKTGTANNRNFLSTHRGNLMLEKGEQASLLLHCTHDCPASSGNKVWNIGNLHPLWLLGLLSEIAMRTIASGASVI